MGGRSDHFMGGRRPVSRARRIMLVSASSVRNPTPSTCSPCDATRPNKAEGGQRASETCADQIVAERSTPPFRRTTDRQQASQQCCTVKASSSAHSAHLLRVEEVRVRDVVETRRQRRPLVQEPPVARPRLRVLDQGGLEPARTHASLRSSEPATHTVTHSHSPRSQIRTKQEPQQQRRQSRIAKRQKANSLPLVGAAIARHSWPCGQRREAAVRDQRQHRNDAG